MKVMMCPHCGREMPTPILDMGYRTRCKECFTTVVMNEKTGKEYMGG